MTPRVSFRGMAVLAAFLALSVAGCASQSGPRFLIGNRAQSQDIRIQVVNDNFLDMSVYAMTDGVNLRLGDVTGKSSDSFTLDLDRVSPSQGLRLLADPIGSRNAFLSDAVSVIPGTTVILNISPDLQQSFVTLR